jgi:hypothetical protein
MQILEAHHFRLPACRFVLDLFDKRVLQQIVLEEEDEMNDDDTSESESDSEVEYTVRMGLALRHAVGGALYTSVRADAAVHSLGVCVGRIPGDFFWCLQARC